ncbi:bis(5'-nucleosyl)-tetraphosphatase (symmetrical) YqeK [Virgibacillus halophilus]|uniref:bis(5'-nucleosyl)-tetraphosphatase (symmetrical) n=1 Tax=Tigheibacillus halophilus TaxID=361280 RepID=A0ABU5CBS6_9BACI|nr:bis(5'-nucleosyl)-tetraphosphatase (symmetrical) YqeK [Virgibacillus halophilus]
MDLKEAKAAVKPYLTTKRYEHTLRVADTAAELSDRFHASKNKAQFAAVFHDYAKYRSVNEMKRWILQSPELPKDLLYYHPELWHGPVGSILVEREHGIKDREIQSAVRYHTTGKAHMSDLELIVFVADYIEPGRDFPGLDKIREMAEHDLVKTAWMVSSNTIAYLLKKGNPIYPDTFYAYNDLTKRINGGN